MTDSVENALINKARSFGRVDEDGKVFVKFGNTEEQVGQYDTETGEIDKDMTLYVMRYVDQISKMHLFERRLGQVSSITPAEVQRAIAGFEEFGKQFNAVGDYIALQQYVIRLKEQAEKRISTLETEHAELVATTLSKLTELANKMQALTSDLGGGASWNKLTAEVDELFNSWKEVRGNVRLEANAIDPLWERFSAGMGEFNKQKRHWLGEMRKKNKETREHKAKLIAKVESLKDSEDLQGTKKQFIDILNLWKKLPRGERKTDDKQWAEFKTIQDYFFERLQKEQKENASKDDGKKMTKSGRNGGRDKAPKSWSTSEQRLTTTVGNLDALAALKAKLEK